MSVFAPLFSGSSGNSTFIGNAHSGILIDAGVSAKSLSAALCRHCGAENIRGIFVTHEHIDHIKGLRVLAARHHIPVFASEQTVCALRRDEKLAETVDIIPFEHSIEIDSMSIERFDTSHDCIGSSGYRVTLPDGKTAAVCTDLGVITDAVMSALNGCDLVMLESNHDLRMLQNGSYPYSLKQRILSDNGHLSNDCCADTLCKLVNGGTTRFILAHLSRDNNHPSIAHHTATSALSLVGASEQVDYILGVASPTCSITEVL